MNIKKHGESGSHWGRSSNDDELVIHHGRGQIQLSREQAYLLCYEVLSYLEENPQVED
jgi:hypothetical protein